MLISKFTTYLTIIISLINPLKVNADQIASSAFPMIMYAVPGNDKSFQEVKSLGINYVHLYGLSRNSPSQSGFEKIKNYLDLANKYGLKVMLDLDGNELIKGNNVKKMQDIVEAFKYHPALGYWYLSDEPDNKGITSSQLLPYYQMIKKESPNIPIVVCHAWTKNWYKFNNVQDIILHDIYPVTGETFPNSKLNHQTDFTFAAINSSKGKHVIPVLQFFNWKSGVNSKSQKTLKGFSVNKLRYPTFEEFRFLCFSTIAQGVNGLAFYSFARNKMINSNWINEVASPILKEVVTFTNKVKGEKMQFKDLSNKNSGFILSEWSNGSAKVYILVNSTNTKKSFDIYKIAGIKPSNLTLIQNLNQRNANLNIQGNSIIADVKPWEVLIFETNISD